uniref:Uncharacterized protein n=1 Tax=Timema shepardi TaxID=629360 RepID=A0A7R9ATK9_TIMSH|nr:unnamed protein product [Timema shepardi]
MQYVAATTSLLGLVLLMSSSQGDPVPDPGRSPSVVDVGALVAHQQSPPQVGVVLFSLALHLRRTKFVYEIGLKMSASVFAVTGSLVFKSWLGRYRRREKGLAGSPGRLGKTSMAGPPRWMGQARLAGSPIWLGETGMAGPPLPMGKTGMERSRIHMGEAGVAGPSRRLGKTRLAGPSIWMGQASLAGPAADVTRVRCDPTALMVSSRILYFFQAAQRIYTMRTPRDGVKRRGKDPFYSGTLTRVGQHRSRRFQLIVVRCPARSSCLRSRPASSLDVVVFSGASDSTEELGGWGKRSWDDLRPMWGKRLYDLYRNQLLSDADLEALEDAVEASDEEDDQENAEKRAWRSLGGSWGKRASSDWANFKGYILRKWTHTCMECEWKTILEKTLSAADRDSKIDIIISMLFYCKSSALVHMATEVGDWPADDGDIGLCRARFLSFFLSLSVASRFLGEARTRMEQLERLMGEEREQVGKTLTHLGEEVDWGSVPKNAIYTGKLTRLFYTLSPQTPKLDFQISSSSRESGMKEEPGAANNED